MLVLGFPEEQLPCSRSSLDVAKKRADKPDSNFREGSSAELGICSQLAWGSAYCGKSSKRPPWKWWIFRWIFWGRIFSRKIQNPPKKSAGKSASQRGPKIRRKTYQQIRLSNLQVHAGFFRLRRLALGGVVRAWVLGHSLAAFWAWSRLPC